MSGIRLVEHIHRQLGRPSSTITGNSCGDSDLDGPTMATARGPDTTTSSVALPLHGRVRIGVGGPPASSLCSFSQPVDYPGESFSQQQTRDVSSVESYSVLVYSTDRAVPDGADGQCNSVCIHLQTTDRAVPDGADGQCNSVCIHLQTRRNKIPITLPACTGSTDFLRCAGHHAVSASHTGKVQCDHGWSQMSEASTDRVAFAPGSVSKHSEAIPGTGDRSVCYSIQRPAVPVRVAIPRRDSNGRGRTRCRLARERSVRLPSDGHHSDNSSASGELRVQHDSGSSPEMEQDLDFSASGQMPGDTIELTNTTRLAAAAPIRRPASVPRTVESSCFSSIWQSLEQRRYTTAAIDKILCSRRTSTLRVYDKKWDVFMVWCAHHNEVPLDLEPNVLCDFFPVSF